LRHRRPGCQASVSLLAAGLDPLLVFGVAARASRAISVAGARNAVS
jgi:hypothetical protein